MKVQRSLIGFACGALVLIAAPRFAAAQGNEQLGVTLLYGHLDPQGVRGSVFYVVGGRPVIAVEEKTATPEDLEEAVRVLRRMRKSLTSQSDIAAGSIGRIDLVGRRPRMTLSADQRKNYGALLADVAKGTDKALKNIGKGKTTEIEISLNP